MELSGVEQGGVERSKWRVEWWVEWSLRGVGVKGWELRNGRVIPSASSISRRTSSNRRCCALGGVGGDQRGV